MTIWFWIITPIFTPTTELVIPTVTQTNKENAEIETQPMTVDAKISKCAT